MAKAKGHKTVKKREPADEEPIAPESKEGHPPKSKPFKAEPLIMVEPPRAEESLCKSQITPYESCAHKKAMHYGGTKGHCNTSGCLCQEFK